MYTQNSGNKMYISLTISFSDLLIDISDVLQICCYQLGRTYLRLSQALCINIPSIGESFHFTYIKNQIDYHLHRPEILPVGRSLTVGLRGYATMQRLCRPSTVAFKSEQM